jgi:hypothetical protein
VPTARTGLAMAVVALRDGDPSFWRCCHTSGFPSWLPADDGIAELFDRASPRGGVTLCRLHRTGSDCLAQPTAGDRVTPRRTDHCTATAQWLRCTTGYLRRRSRLRPAVADRYTGDCWSRWLADVQLVDRLDIKSAHSTGARQRRFGSASPTARAVLLAHRPRRPRQDSLL